MKLILFDTLDLFVGLVILACLLFVIWRRGRSLPYLLFFSVFWMYLLVVVSKVVLPIVIGLNDSNAAFSPDINLVPFQYAACSMPARCAAEVIQNMLLTVPFGFGINFLLRVKPRSLVWLAPATGLALELAQLAVTVIFKSHFHVFDINDVISNGLGVLIGYAIFRVFAWGYVKLADHLGLTQQWLLADIYAVASSPQDPRRSKSA